MQRAPYLILLLVSLGVGFGLSGPARAAQSRDVSTLSSSAWRYCRTGAAPRVRLGLLAGYSLPAGKTVTRSNRDRLLCARIARGNPYQLLSWLENGEVHAAVLPPFAATVLRADDPKRYAREYVEFSVSPLPSLRIQRRAIALKDAAGRAADISALDRFFENLRTGDRSVLLLPHHLSNAVPVLFERARQWVAARDLSKEARDRFFAALLDRMRFRIDADASLAPGETAALELVETRVTGAPRESLLAGAEPDRMIVHREAAARMLGLDLSQVSLPRDSQGGDLNALFASSLDVQAQMGPAVAAFAETNYARHQSGAFERRDFRFTIAELWALLQAHARAFAPRTADEPGGFALVLTGGGVKAAYQTRLLDYLYRQDWLTNDVAYAGGNEYRPQRVDYIIGTSGGALLGIFVSALDSTLLKKLSGGLTPVLWRTNSAGIQPQAVFPRLDMLRYASIIGVYLMITLMATLVIGLRPRRFAHVQRLTPQERKLIVGRARWRAETPAWLLLLVLAPVLIALKAHISIGMEHVPKEAGIFYVGMALVALYADLRLRPRARFNWRHARVPRASLVAGVLGILAVLISIFATWRNGSGELAECEAMPPAIWLYCIGFLGLAWGLYWFFRAQRRYFEIDKSSQPTMFVAFGAILGVVVLSYLTVIVARLFGVTSLLELTANFWFWLLGAALAWSLVLLILGRSAERKATQWPQRVVGYMFSEHPTRGFFSHRRYTRFLSLAILSWVWWNLLAAPGLYGNCNARTYFKQTFADFAAATDREGEPLALKVPFVVTATSLVRGQERYFLFEPNLGDSASTLSASAWFRFTSDPRWVVAGHPTDEDLRRVAFASGSPFPVFSSHEVELSGLSLKERLIDGGFAHNRPLEAARALGANRVLVLNSSPIEVPTSSAGCLLFGRLACDLPKLVPYLWQRSQVEDQLSSERMLVASIYPTAAGDAWPLLTDFRPQVVNQMVAAAAGDVNRRVGIVESWGAPPFERTRLLDYAPAKTRGAFVHDTK